MSAGFKHVSPQSKGDIKPDAGFQLLDKLLGRVIAFHPIFAELTGSANAGLLLSQAYYWSKTLPADRLGWFFKTREDWAKETRLTRYEQESARNALRQFDFWSEELRGVPARLWFRVDVPNLYRAILQLVEKPPTSWRQNPQVNGGKTASKPVEKPPAFKGTETTSESQSVITSEKTEQLATLSSFSDWTDQTLLQEKKP